MLLRYGAKVNFECDSDNSVLDLVWEEKTFLSMDDDNDENKAVIERLDKIYDTLERHGAKYFCDPDFEDDFKE